MAFTLPPDKGGFRTYDSTGAIIYQSNDDQVGIFVSLHVNATAIIEGATTIKDTTTIYGSLIVHADATFDGNTVVGGTFTVNGTTLLGGTLTLTANLNANGFQIHGGSFNTDSGIVISGSTITLGGSSLTFDGIGVIFSGRVYAPDIQSTGALSVAGVFSHVGSTFGVFGASPTGRPSVTGSRGGNVALADLLGSLADLGLIADDSTA